MVTSCRFPIIFAFLSAILSTVDVMGQTTLPTPTLLSSGVRNAATMQAECTLPESPHPYPNDADLVWTCSLEGATSIDIKFDPATSVEAGADWIYVLDADGNNISGSPFTGKDLAGQTKTVVGSKFSIRLVSDGRRTDFGFKVIDAAPQLAAVDLAVSKTHTGNFFRGQTGAAFLILVSNIGGAVANGTVSVSDLLPAGLTAQAIAGNGWNCVQPTGPCTRADSLGAGSAYPALTLLTEVSASAPDSVTNVATVLFSGDQNLANNTARDTVVIASQGPDLTLTKTHTGRFTLGQAGAAYTITITNAGTGPTNGSAVTVSDTIPAGLAAASVSGRGWTCTPPGGPCTRSDVLDPGASYPPLVLTVNVAGTAASSVTNRANVIGGGDVNPGNNSTSDVTAIDPRPPSCVLESPHPYPSSFDTNYTCALPGNVAFFDLTFDPLTSVEAGADFIDIIDSRNLPVTGSPFTGTQLAGQTIRVTGSSVRIRLRTNSRNNDWGFAVTGIVIGETLDPDLSISKTHAGSFVIGQAGAEYRIVVSNVGPRQSGGGVLVRETLPAGLTAVSMTGTGWICTQPGGPCSRADALAAGTSFPAINVKVNVAQNASANITNSVAVSGGGDVNPANNIAVDPTQVLASAVPDLTITKTHTGDFLAGMVGATYHLVVMNSGAGPTNGIVSVTDSIPAGLTATAMSGTGWTCAGPAGPCTRADSLAPGTAYPAILVTVDVAQAAPSSVINTASVSGGGEVNAANSTAADPTAIRAAFCEYPESGHPYESDVDFTWTCILPPDVAALNVTFDSQTALEPGGDFLYVMDGNGVNIEGSPFTGSQLAGQTKRVPGNVLKLRLVTNRRTAAWGFKVTSIVPAIGNTVVK